jgi:mannan endo-1,4-beta-mannosidase
MRSRLKILLSALLITGCCEVWAQVDSQATRQTLLLYRSMKSRAADSLMYGQHHAYELGTYADGQGNMSDCKHITGENPALVRGAPYADGCCSGNS